MRQRKQKEKIFERNKPELMLECAQLIFFFEQIELKGQPIVAIMGEKGLKNNSASDEEKTLNDSPYIQPRTVGTKQRKEKEGIKRENI